MKDKDMIKLILSISVGNLFMNCMLWIVLLSR